MEKDHPPCNSTGTGGTDSKLAGRWHRLLARDDELLLCLLVRCAAQKERARQQVLLRAALPFPENPPANLVMLCWGSKRVSAWLIKSERSKG